MIVQVASDLHLEFHQDAGRQLLREMEPEDAEETTLVLAGDVAPCAHLESALSRVCAGTRTRPATTCSMRRASSTTRSATRARRPPPTRGS